MNRPINSEVIKDRDPYREAHQRLMYERQVAQQNWQARLDTPEYFQGAEHTSPVVSWEDLDTHRHTANPVLGETSPDVFEALRLDFETKGRQKWLDEREEARWRVRASEKLDEPVSAEVLAKAQEQDYFEGLETFRQEQTEGRRRLRPLR